ncbi:Protein CBG25621 [Caenorhabditis briggsae]|uniref:Protein CBG25621 n=1 Tax=Caenorhabditis briggsae TaxID=6238 RepID=B6IFA6_CAEBR|nr:Protein CBG25621 [Caenorhabditis briggsae]CAR98586.1 Protein CBG25621 [Caenorhabditis briggsae]
MVCLVFQQNREAKNEDVVKNFGKRISKNISEISNLEEHSSFSSGKIPVGWGLLRLFCLVFFGFTLCVVLLEKLEKILERNGVVE